MGAAGRGRARLDVVIDKEVAQETMKNPYRTVGTFRKMHTLGGGGNEGATYRRIRSVHYSLGHGGGLPSNVGNIIGKKREGISPSEKGRSTRGKGGKRPRSYRT